MSERKPLSKSVRFEVFKRDKFTCQYCGAKAPEAVLHCDHIKPVAEGGTNDILNLLTACDGCNLGKGARTISDNSAIEKQRKEIEALEERRQQIEMMLEWREELANHTVTLVETIDDYIAQLTGLVLSEHGKATVKKWLKQFPMETILVSLEDVFEKYGVHSNGRMTSDSFGVAFNKVPAFCRSKLKYGDGPEVAGLIYAQGIVRRRVGDKWFKCIDDLKQLFDAGYSVDQIQDAAKKLESLDDFEAWMAIWLRDANK